MRLRIFNLMVPKELPGMADLSKVTLGSRRPDIRYGYMKQILLKAMFEAMVQMKPALRFIQRDFVPADAQAERSWFLRCRCARERRQQDDKRDG
jgi:hypothetical protein